MQNPNDLLSGIDEVTADQVSEFEEKVGVGFETYISISKQEITPVLRTVEFLSKVSADAYSKNLNITSTKDHITFKYNNAPYLLEYKVENRSGCVIPAVSIPLVNLRKLVNNVSANLILVWQEEQLHICLGENLLYVETTSFDPKHYEFQFSPCEEELDHVYIKEHLKYFTSLLSVSNNAAEKNVICKGEHTYFNASAVMGKSRNFFNDHSIVISKLVVDAICSLAEESKQGIFCNISENRITLDFVGLARCVFPITTDPTIFETFLSPLFLNSFEYKSAALISNESLKQILALVNALDYFTSFVKMEFGKESFKVIAHRKDGGDAEYIFRYLDGEVSPASLNVSIPVLLTVMGRMIAAAQYSTANGNLIVDLDTVVFCVRSNS